MNIPDEAVEAAARELYESSGEVLYSWEDLVRTEGARQKWRVQAEAILEARK